MRRARRLLGYLAVFLAGALCWEAVRLLAMNRADKDDLVDMMIDADARAHPIDLPAMRVSRQPTSWDVLDAKAAAEFARCGGRSPRFGSTELFAATWPANSLVTERDAGKERERRSTIAGANDVFTLRAVAICRYWGGCGPKLPAIVDRRPPALAPWHAQTDRETFIPSTPANAEPFVLSLACGMAVREKEGLPAYPNQARFEAEERAWAADRARRCAGGERAACAPR